MINPLELHLKNFLSYGDNLTIIPLNSKEPVLIVGENLDVVVDGEADNNGAGKTAILNGLAFAGYGRTVSKFEKIDDIINNINKKNAYVAWVFETNNKFYKIERWRKNKEMGGSGGNGVQLKEADTLAGLDTVKPKTPAGRTVDDYIAEEILRMPFDIFVRVVVYSAGFDPFLSLPATSVNKTSQTSILEEVFGQKELTEKAKNLKPRIKDLKADIEHLTELNTKIEEETERYTEQLKLAEQSVETWNDDHGVQIQSIKDEIKELEVIDFEAEIKSQKARADITENIIGKKAELTTLTFQLSEHEKTLKNITAWDITHADDIINAKALLSPYKEVDFVKELGEMERMLSDKALCEANKDAIEKLTGEMDIVYNQISTLNDEVGVLKTAICPYCEQTFHGNESKINEKHADLVKLATVYTEGESNVERVNQSTDMLTERIGQYECMFDSRELYNESKHAYDNVKQKLDDLLVASNPYKVNDDVDVTKIRSDISAIEDDIAHLKTDEDALERDGITLEGLYADQSHLNELKKTLKSKMGEANPHTETVKRLQAVFENLDEPRTEEIDEMTNLLEHQNFMLKLLTRKDSFLRQNLLNANLPLLNTQLRYYLDMIGLPHKAEFTKDMAISISQFNNPIRYSNLSGGQQARINIALAFSFRDVVQARHQKVNFCILDECLDTGLSNLGVKLATKMIKQIAKENNLSMYVITHRDEIKSSFDKKLKATLKGGLTTLEFN